MQNGAIERGNRRKMSLSLRQKEEFFVLKVADVIDNSKFNRFHFLVVLLCGFAMVFDGYELGIYGAAVPSIIKELGISPVQAGAIGSYSLMGMAIGAPLFGTLSDRTGRKLMIIVCATLYTVFTGIIFFSGGPTELGIYRFLAGLGLGGIMPNLIALSNEYSPKHLRSTMVSVMFSGWFAGVAVAALISMVLIPAFGWRSVFLVGGLVPLLVIPVLIKYLPDSLSFYLVKGKTQEVAVILQKINPALRLDSTLRFEVSDGPRRVSPVVNLFRGGYAFATVMFWIAAFTGLLVIYGLQTWLPKLMIEAGYPLRSSLSFLLTLCMAGLVITWVGSYLSDHLGKRRGVLITLYVIGAMFIALLGFAGNIATFYLYVAVALGGGAVFSSQVIFNAYVAQYYQTNMRSTGMGWTLGIGRIGAIVGPLLGGILLAAKVPLYTHFLVFAILALITAVAIFLVRDRSVTVSMGEDLPVKG